MNRITKVFDNLKKEGKTAFIGYITSGDPTIKRTEDLVYALQEGGADIIELGIPYSDPLADGKVIQSAALRAFENEIKVDDIFKCVQNIRVKTEVPLLFLVYYNTIFSMGNEVFSKKCKKVGIDGLIVPDLPLEERDELKKFTDEDNICLIPLVAPTSKSRVKDIAKNSKGFIYCVSSMGVTGTRDSFNDNIVEYLQEIKKQTDLPIAIGFGIRDKKTVDFFSKHVDGVIVGSAIVQVVKKTNGDVKKVKEFVKELSGK